LLTECRHTALCQSLNRETAVLPKRILLRGEKKFFAPSARFAFKFEDPLYQCVRLGTQPIRRADLRDKPDLERAVRVDRLAKQNQGKGVSRQNVLT